MTELKSALMKVQGGSSAPTLDEAASQLGLKAADLNSEFGVILVDPDANIYAVEVAKPDPITVVGPSGAYHGPYSNPKISPFGPVSDTKPAKPIRTK